MVRAAALTNYDFGAISLLRTHQRTLRDVPLATIHRELEFGGEYNGFVCTAADLDYLCAATGLRYVESRQYSLGHVAGYATQTSFTRWFKTEFGVTPCTTVNNIIAVHRFKT